MPGVFAPTYDPRPVADGPPPPRRLQAYAALTAVAFAAYILGNIVHGGVGLVLAAIGASSCGWSWLLARALFDPTEGEARWPILVMALLLVSGAGSELLPGGGALPAVVDNIYALVGSAALLLAFVEPLNGWRGGLSVTEKRFRLAFLTVYAGLVAVSILFLRDSGAPGEAERIAMTKSACALTGLLTGGAAVWFRSRYPLAARSKDTPARAATEDDRRLAERIERLLCDEEVFATPDLKVADLARKLGEPDYRISQAITAAMGFANFNRLINHHRIEKAKGLLTEPHGRRLSILQIAFECGFGSIGPFNRAFKEATGVTPGAYRSRP